MKRILRAFFYAGLIFLTFEVYALPPGSGELLYIHNDALGTPQAMTDESGNVVWTAETDPFGGAKVNEDPDGDGKNIELNARFPGQYNDKETGLHYNYARYYDPGTGRYLSSDPIGLKGGLNTYAYVGGNPLSRIDPDGKRWVPCDTITNSECWVPDPATDSLPDGKCVTAECAGGLLPAPLDLRPLDQITCESCIFTCQMSFIFGPGPVIPLSRLGLGKYLGEKGLQVLSCEKICEDDCKNCPVN